MTDMHKSVVALVVGAMFTASGAAMAAHNNNSFMATPSGDWNTAANWSLGTVPVRDCKEMK